MISEAVILAGGKSSRLIKYTGGKPKWSLSIRGKPMIYYPISALRSVGVNRFIIIVAKKWFREMSKLLRRMNIDYELVPNNYVERENGFSFLLSKDYVTDNYFYLSMSDHIYSAKLLHVLQNKKYSRSHLVICGDREPLFIDVSEATKILSDRRENIIAIGKNVRPFTHVDTGVFLISKRIFHVAEKLASSRYSFTMSDIVNKSVKYHYYVKVATIYRGYWTEIDTISDLTGVKRGKRRAVLDAAIRSIRYEEYIREISERELVHRDGLVS